MKWGTTTLDRRRQERHQDGEQQDIEAQSLMEKEEIFNGWEIIRKQKTT